MASSPEAAPESSTVTGSNFNQPAHLRSCILCRQRKVKCDRRQPCSNCVRAGANCVHPPGAGRAAKRPRQMVDDRVLNRLAQLEATIKHLQQQSTSRTGSSHLTHEPAPRHASPGHSQAKARDSQGFLIDDSGQGSAVSPEIGRLVVEESESLYVSNVMWADLTESIDQLRGMFLDNDTGEDASQLDESIPFHEGESPPPESLGSNAALLGYRSLVHSLRDFHPPIDLSMKLFQIFCDNVLPIAYMFHKPTLTRIFWEAVLKPDALDKETEALLFAIYYSAVISLDSAQCSEIVGEPRSTLVERYRFAVEQALARANFLSTKSTLLLRAAVIYVTVLRTDDGTRTVFSLIALVSHIARSMGLHRDGTAFNLSPFETEMRRRIWASIIILDYRSTEYHGYEPNLPSDTVFDTRFPLNVNDSDLSPDMAELPPESDGPTDLSFTHVRCVALELIWKIIRQSRSPFQVRLRLLEEHDKWIEKYVERFDPSQPVQRLARHIAYVSSGRVRAVAYYSELVSRKRRGEATEFHTVGGDANAEAPSPSDGSSHTEPDGKTLRDWLFTAAIAASKRTSDIMHDPDLQRWAWQSYTVVQWQTLALMLWEVCIRPPSPQCDEAWKYATDIYDQWLSVKVRNSTERGDYFTKPMNRLLVRARRVREAQQAERQKKAQAPTQPNLGSSGAGKMLVHGQEFLYDMNTGAPFLGADTMVGIDQGYSATSSNFMVTTTAPANSNPPIGPPVDGISDFSNFMDMLPDEFQSEWLASMAPRNYETPTAPFTYLS
ncbi:hypothetical protein GGR50DRAFT_661690 [Xylaria sp. CBS 124048]|nr:hypothetical protein GGR50DRAFT_661690 [Xylaria sp. CBS 124048]